MPKTLIRVNAAVDPILLALKPRQVLLANANSMKKPSQVKASSGALTADQKALLFEAVAQFLDRNGFPRTLKKFRSEAQVEKDGSKGSTLDLEEIYYKYLEMSHDKKISQFLGQGTEQLKTELLKERAGHIVGGLLDEEPDEKRKAKKTKKSKSGSGSLANSTEHNLSESQPEATEEKAEEMGPSDGQSVGGSDREKRPKDKKKKKDKPICDSLGDAKQDNLDDKQGAVTTKVEDVQCSSDFQANNPNVALEEKSVKSKSMKKQQCGSVCGNSKDVDVADVNEKDSEKNECKTLDEDAANNKKKGSKKRKRLASEENDVQRADEKVAEELKHRKVEGLVESERCEQQAKINASLGSDRSADKELDNGNLEKKGEKSAFQKTKKQHNGSVELKTVNAFQRVKADEVVFTDERLKDNSYWAKNGAESGYGAKAQEILGQVRGRDFRHEKTKKKRGSYRGGQIDLQSYSVKFNYSDEE